MAPVTGRSLRRLAVLAALPLIIAGLPLAAGADPEPDDAPVVPPGTADGADLVEVVVDDQAGVIDLIAAGADVTEYARPVTGGLEVHVVATQEEQDDLRARGFAVGDAVVTDEQTEAVVAEREAAIERVDQLSTLATDTLTVLRSEWFTSIGGVT